jgi:phosphoribosyl-ATP pyrophosphohydrolase/phosphoribosyl-AMP cyclohydrolase
MTNSSNFNIEKLKFNSENLIPAIIQDNKSGEVLMMAYMNPESLKKSIDTGLTCFWSRSRECYWTKGEESGNLQHIVSIFHDCDADTLLVKVNKDGPACHTGEESCFFNSIVDFGTEENEFSINALYDLIVERKANLPENSYTSYLFSSGREKIQKKIGEESAEVIIAAGKDSVPETVYEIADLCYHALVLMADMKITPEDINNELKKRFSK